MNMTTLKDLIRNAIHDDATLQSWCTANYSHAHKVLVGVDLRNPPPDSYCPWVGLAMISKKEGYGAEEVLHGFDLICCLHDSETVTVAGKAGIIEMRGVNNIETMRKYVLDATSGAMPAGMEVTAAESEYEPIVAFPFFWAGMEITITQPYYQGDDVFT